MSYWNRPFFPEFCSDGTFDDPVTYDTMVRIAGSWVGVAQSFKAVADMYGWTHIVLVTGEETLSICWYGGKPFDEVFGNDDNYTFTWLKLHSKSTDEEIDDVLQQIRSRTRGVRERVWRIFIFCAVGPDIIVEDRGQIELIVLLQHNVSPADVTNR